MVMEFGMSDVVGPISIGDGGPRFLAPAFRRGESVSEETEVAIDREVKSLLTEARERARTIVSDHRSDLDALAKELLEKESLERSDLDRYFGGDGAVSPAAITSPGAPAQA
jgi:cell division protease FtsH